MPRLLASLALIVALPCFVIADEPVQPDTAPAKILRAGMIGLDTSHVIVFPKQYNDPQATGSLAKVDIVAGYPGGTDIPDSRDRVQGFTEDLRKQGIEIYKTIPELLDKVDVILLESVDGRIHLEEAAQVIKAGKPLFIDKPAAGSLADAIVIYELAKKHNVPIWSGSSERFTATFQGLRGNDETGKVIGCSTWGPCKYQVGIPDMFYYGIHGIEGLYTVMGPGCESLTRTTTPDTDVITGVWKDGRVGTYRGLRRGKAIFGGTTFGTKKIISTDQPSGSGYPELCEQMAKFFLTHEPPVSADETLEILAFMEAADANKQQGGAPVTLESVMTKARAKAAAKLAKME